MELDTDEEEWSVLRYARHYGLCKRYDRDVPQIGSLPALSHIDFDRDLCDLSYESITNTPNALTRERLAVSKDAALLLKTVHELQQALADEILVVNRRQRILDLKQELPVLSTDNELDMLNFGSVAIPSFNDLKIPFEIVSEDSDEGFEWPTRYLKYPSQCEAQIKSERLTVTRDVLFHLQDTIRDSYTSEDYQKISGENSVYQPVGEVRYSRKPLTMQNKKHRLVTPPLLPLSPPMTPYIPSSPANRLPVMSDSGDSVIAEAKTLEYRIMSAEILTRKSSDSSDSMLLDITHPPQFSPFFAERTPMTLKRKVSDLKVEGPLTPPVLSDSPMKKLKSVTFPETLYQFIPEAPWVKKSDEEDEEGSDLDFDKLFEDIESYTREATRMVQHEKLSEPDTTARVDIPDVDFTAPIAPWNEYSQRKVCKHRPGGTELGAQMKFLLRIKREDLKAASSWHGLSSLERNMQWSIFTTKISKIDLDETLHGETDLDMMIAQTTASDIARSSSQVWKPHGLRILDEDNYEDPIELADEEECRDMEALIRKRKMEVEEEEEAIEKRLRRTMSQSLPYSRTHSPQLSENGVTVAHQHANMRSRTFNSLETRPQSSASRHKAVQAARDDSNNLMFGGFSATAALHKFMETRGQVVDSASTKPSDAKESAKDTLRPTHGTLPSRPREASLSNFGPDSQQLTHQLIAKAYRRQEAPPSLPQLPAVPENLAPCSFIISSVFLQQRSLMKHIERLYLQAEIIYRDYGRPHSPAKEADMILSPSTGMILTTLQQIKQRPLPGQPDRSPVKERMSAMNLRYERLIVVISEGLSQEMEKQGSSRPDDPRDKEALAGLENFANHSDCEVIIKYIPGGEQALARAIIIYMTKYGLIHGSQDIGDIKPVADETTVSTCTMKLSGLI
jgi:hypothetical protein